MMRTGLLGHDARVSATDFLELAQRQVACCKHGTKSQPCGNTSIRATAKCNKPTGCPCALRSGGSFEFMLADEPATSLRLTLPNP